MAEPIEKIPTEEQAPVAQATPAKEATKPVNEKPVVKPADKSLADKAIDYNGKKYVLVSDRVNYFNETYKNGCIITELTKDEGTVIQFIAKAIPNIEKPERYYIGHSEEIRGVGFVNKTSAVENAETSAVGRALAFMGIGVIDSIASVDEINIAKGKEVKMAQAPIDTTVKVDKPTADFDI